MATHLETERRGYNHRWCQREAGPLTACGRPARLVDSARFGELPTCRACLRSLARALDALRGAVPIRVSTREEAKRRILTAIAKAEGGA